MARVRSDNPTHVPVTDVRAENGASFGPKGIGFGVEGGVHIIKYWLEVSNKEQSRRFEARIHDPLRQWKLSPVDMPSREKWYEYSRARDLMLKATDTEHAPWYILNSDDKKRARLSIQLYDLSPELCLSSVSRFHNLSLT